MPTAEIIVMSLTVPAYTCRLDVTPGRLGASAWRMGKVRLVGGL